MWYETHLLVELDVLQHLDGLVVVAQQGVQAQKPHQAEVAQHLVERVAAILPSHALWVSCKRECTSHQPHQVQRSLETDWEERELLSFLFPRGLWRFGANKNWPVQFMDSFLCLDLYRSLSQMNYTVRHKSHFTKKTCIQKIHRHQILPKWNLE